MTTIDSINSSKFNRDELFKNRIQDVHHQEFFLDEGMWTSLVDIDDDAVLLVLGVFGVTFIDEVVMALKRNSEFLIFGRPSCAHYEIHIGTPESEDVEDGIVDPKKFVSAYDILQNIGELAHYHVGEFDHLDTDRK